MKARSQKIPENPQPKSVSTMIRDAIERNGYKDVKECARIIKVPYDLFNKVVGGHIPKDSQLVEYAKKLNIDSRELILAAYRERAPEDMKGYFNSVLLLEDHNDNVREIIKTMDTLNMDQLKELSNVARLIHKTPRDFCRKALALLSVYQQMPQELMEHFDSLVLLLLRKEELKGLKEFREEIEVQKKMTDNHNRRGRRRA